jgi:ankyrin repeat protein
MTEELTKEIVLAAEAGNLEVVKAALKKGARPDAMGPNSGALHCAASNGHKDVVKVLLKAGANPNIADQQSFYPIQLAASKGHTPICSLLIKGGADIEVATNKGGTALHVAAASGYPKTVNALVKAGANIEVLDIYGVTPLNTAAAQGQSACIKALLKVGANVATKDKYDETPLLKASRRLYQTRVNDWYSGGTNSGREVKYTITKGAFRYYNGYEKANDPYKLGQLMSLKDQKYCASQSWGPSEHLLYLEAFETIKTLIKAKADLNAANDGGQSPMWMACTAGDAKAIKELHKAGATFDAVEDNGEFMGATCLHKVAASGRLDGLEMCFELDKKTAINVLDGYGWTPLHYLADMGGHISMAELLLKKGAEKNLKGTKDRGQGTPKGVTASDVAFHWKDNEIGNLLK